MNKKEVAFKQQFSSLMPVLVGSMVFLAFMFFNIYYEYVNLNTYSKVVMLGAGFIVLLTTFLRLFIPVAVVSEEGILLKRLFKSHDFVPWTDVTGFKIVKKRGANSKKVDNGSLECCVLISTVHSKTWYSTDEDFIGFKSEGHTIQVGKSESDHLELLETLQSYHEGFKKKQVN